MRCCTRTLRASCIWSRIPAMRARWCSATATPRSGSIRRRFPRARRTWMRSTSCRMRAARIPPTAMRAFPAYHMIRFSVAIQRGCFGGCTFCSITEHEGRIIQSRSEDSVIREIETIRDTVPGIHRRRVGSRRPDREHVPPALQECSRRVRLPPALMRVSRRLSEFEYRPCAAHQLCTAARARSRASRKCSSPPACATISRSNRPST